jgi:hypothetical protein
MKENNFGVKIGFEGKNGSRVQEESGKNMFETLEPSRNHYNHLMTKWWLEMINL